MRFGRAVVLNFPMTCISKIRQSMQEILCNFCRLTDIVSMEYVFFSFGTRNITNCRLDDSSVPLPSDRMPYFHRTKRHGLVFSEGESGKLIEVNP